MATEKLIEEDRVLIFETLQKGVFPQSSVSRQQLVIRTLTLLIERVNSAWETTDETELLALIDCERSAFVPVRISENSVASKSDARDLASVTGGHGRT